MAMSRRKQPRPKSFKGCDEILFVLPNEVELDKKTNNIITRTNLTKEHRFGPFPAIIRIEDEIECFQLLDIKHNWLAHCSLLKNCSVNLKIIFQDNQLFAIITESILIGTHLCTNKIILPQLNMNKDIQIKGEPVETKIKIESSTKKHYPLVFICETCDIRFSNRDTLDAHRQHYCTTRATTKSHSTDSSIPVRVKSMKRKSTDNTDSSSTPTKRLSLLSNDSYCHECDILFSKADNLIQHKLHYCPINSSSCKIKNKTIPFDRPVQIGKFIYVPIPVIPSQVDTSNQDNKPLDLSKPKKITDECRNSIVPSNSPLDLSIEKNKKIVQQQKLYPCEYCSIFFRSLKTLHAHQDNYCVEYGKQKKNDNKKLLTNTIDTSRSQSSPPLSLSAISKSLSNDSLNSNHRSTLFICRLCQYRGNTLRGMRMHFKFHLSNNEPCSDDDIIIKSSTVPPPPPTQLLLRCTICSAMFDYEETLLNHIKCVHTNEVFLKCLACQSRFCSKWNLIRHMKLSHTNIKYDEQEQDDQQIKSNECLLDKNNKSSDSMNLITEQIDMKSIERNLIKKKFSCLFCHIKFRSIDTLKQHMTSYCSSRPTTNDIKKKIQNGTYCLTCQISFQHKASYDAHKMYYCRGSSQTHDKILA